MDDVKEFILVNDRGQPYEVRLIASGADADSPIPISHKNDRSETTTRYSSSAAQPHDGDTEEERAGGNEYCADNDTDDDFVLRSDMSTTSDESDLVERRRTSKISDDFQEEIMISDSFRDYENGSKGIFPNDGIDTDEIDDVPFETDVWYEREAKIIEKFYGDDAVSCCTLNCNKKIPKDLVLSTRKSFQKMDPTDQDLVMVAHLQSHCRVPCLKEAYDKKNNRRFARLPPTYDESYQTYLRYWYHDIEVCHVFFFFIYDIGRQRYENVVRHFFNFDIVNLLRRNVEQASPLKKNAITLDERLDMLEFINTYTEKHAFNCALRALNGKNLPGSKARASISKKEVYRQYVKAVQHENCAIAENKDDGDSSQKIPKKIYSYKSFLRVWNTRR